jgi:hypothetical protein
MLQGKSEGNLRLFITVTNVESPRINFSVSKVGISS